MQGRKGDIPTCTPIQDDLFWTRIGVTETSKGKKGEKGGGNQAKEDQGDEGGVNESFRP